MPRIQKLEDALAGLQSSLSSEPHPLLRDELLSIKLDPDMQSPDFSERFEDGLAKTMEIFGTLAIGENGQSRYFGPSAGSETLFSTNEKPEPSTFQPEASIPELLNDLAGNFFMGGGYASDSRIFKNAMTLLFDALPPSPRAWSLCEIFLEFFSWNCQLVRREDLIEDFLTPIYNAKKENGSSIHDEASQISPHKLAFLFLVFAQGALMDLTLPAYNEEAERYHHYARAALALRSLIDQPTVETVQSIVLMAHYRGGAGERYPRDGIWAFLSLGCKLAQTIGMHRDPSRWHMDEKTVECRRRIFWEVYSGDLMVSLLLGRPPSIELSYVDCAFPRQSEDVETQFRNWVYQFIRDVFGSVVKLTLAAVPPSYTKILELDRKVRDMIVPPAVNEFLALRADTSGRISPGAYMKGCLLSQLRSMSMLFIHKSFFAQALLDHPENPLRSAYATSFLAAYRSASAIIRTAIGQISGFPDLFLRWWPIWSQLFSSAIIVGSVVRKAPSSSIASSAFDELVLVVDLFEKSAGVSVRARTVLDILKKLKEKASIVLSQYRSAADNVIPTMSIINSQDDGTDELALFGGQTPFLVAKSPSSFSQHLGVQLASTAKQSDSMPSNNTPRTSSSPPLDRAQDEIAIPEVHPSLVQYMYPPDRSSLSATLAADLTTDPQPQPSNYLIPGEISVLSQNAGLPTQVSVGLDDDSTALGMFQQFYEEAAPMPAATLENWGTDAMGGLSMVMGDGDGLEEQWLAFMRESGMVI
ncbi:hypothetical protein HWV62_97 [Athelia sp. TMB]|nr:hypothetical protein HWV62_97 [Athelia sp. TMB]